MLASVGVGEGGARWASLSVRMLGFVSRRIRARARRRSGLHDRASAGDVGPAPESRPRCWRCRRFSPDAPDAEARPPRVPHRSSCAAAQLGTLARGECSGRPAPEAPDFTGAPDAGARPWPPRVRHRSSRAGAQRGALTRVGNGWVAVHDTALAVPQARATSDPALARELIRGRRREAGDPVERPAERPRDS
jgi:hypothetical protein